MNSRTKKKLFILASLIIGLLAIAYIFSAIPWEEIHDALRGATFHLVILFLLVQLLLFLTLTWRWKIVLESQGIKNIGVFKLLGYRIAGYAISFITPAAKLGGEPVRAWLLSKKENIPFRKALSGVVIDKTIDLSTAGVFFILGVLLVLISYAISPEIRQILILVAIIFLFLVILFNYRMMKGKDFFYKAFTFTGLSKIKKLDSFKQKLIDFEKPIIKFYHKDKKHFIQTILVSALSWLLMFIEYSILGDMVGVNLSLIEIFLIVSFVGVAIILPVPMALGTLEAGQIGAFGLIGLSAATGLALALLVRVKDIVFAVAGLIILGIHGLKIKDAVKKTEYAYTKRNKK